MMKKYNKYMLLLILIIIPFTNVNADCTDSEYFNYQQLSIPISLSYSESTKLLDENNNPIKGVYSIHIAGLDDNLYLYNTNIKLNITPDLKENGVISINGLESGEYIFEVKTSNCQKTIKELKITLPKYNIFANREECKNIDPKKFALCDKWYPYEINETDFIKRITSYNNSLENKKEVKEEPQTITEEITKYYNKYQKEIIIGVILVFIIITIIYLIKKRRRKLKYQIDLTKIK